MQEEVGRRVLMVLVTITLVAIGTFALLVSNALSRPRDIAPGPPGIDSRRAKIECIIDKVQTMSPEKLDKLLQKIEEKIHERATRK